MWTSFSTACLAASFGVWKRGPTSTSKPKSANEVAITFAPLSCPSCPILAIIILGRLPFFTAKSSDKARAFLKVSLFCISILYTPEIVWFFAIYLPNTVSIASDISPSVALSLAAVTAISNKFPVLFLQAEINALNDAFTFSLSLLAFMLLSLSICNFLTAVLSTSNISSSLSSFDKRFVFTPTIISFPLSILACFLAAACSILIFGIPVSIAFVIPPSSSISWMCFQDFSAISCVNFST